MEAVVGVEETGAVGEGVEMRVDSERGTGYKWPVEPGEHPDKAGDQKPEITKTGECRRFHGLLKQVIKAQPLRRVKAVDK